MKRISVVIILTVYLTSSCTEPSLISRPYPRVNTIAVESVGANDVTFSGEIFYADVPIRDHGFLFSPYANPVLGQSDKISLGPKDGTGRFEATADWGLEAGKTYFMRAYAVSDNKEVYGDFESFVAKGSAKPTITGIFPDKATWGDTLNVLGENFSVQSITNQVFINNTLVDIIGGNKDTVRVKVPYYLTVEFSEIRMSRKDGISISPKPLQLKGPEIQSITPASGAAGTTVTISGLYINSTVTKIYFNGVSAPLADLTPNGVVVKVPEGVSPGTAQVLVTTGDGGLYDTTTFTVL
jgi:hypothetical protein